MLMNTLLLVPIRVTGFFRMAHPPNWGTRKGSYVRHGGRRNPAAAIPYALGLSLFAIALLATV
jgi:hyaluronan synthase